MLPIQITGHNIEITQSLRTLIDDKFARLERHIDSVTNIHLVLDVVKLRQTAEIRLHIPGSEIYAKAESDDMYKTIDLLLKKLIKQLDKHRGKTKTERHR